MECYDTCCDRGKRCALPRDKICCPDCGKLNPCYNIQSVPCHVCPPKEPCNCDNKKETEKWRSNDVCNCKQSCWQWILSFLGIGGALPECCRNVRLTAWESGEVARDTLVSKVQQVVNQVSGRGAVQARSSKIFDKVETKEAEKKAPTAILTSDKEGQAQDTSDESPDQLPGKEQGQAGTDKRRKTRNSSLPRGRTKHRKTGRSKSRSTSRGGKQKAGSKTQSGSSSSTSLSQGDRRRKRSRSRSGSATKIFNPFKGRIPSPSCGTKSHYCPPLPCLSCSGTQPKAHLSCLIEDRIASFPEKCPSLTQHQTTRSAPRQQSGIRRSNSMLYRTKDTCLQQDPEHCYCCTAGASKIPLRSLSFDSTPRRFTCPRACCLSDQSSFPRSHTWTCSSSMKSDAIMTPYIRGSGVGKASPSCSQSGVRPRTSVCPSSCTKPCCLPGIHSSQPYRNKHEPRQYTSPTSTAAKASCCAAHNIMKARQNDALCNQLLSKYGYSPPSVRLCPLTCCGCNTTSMCCPTTCLKYGRFPGMGGCVACRPMADCTNCTVCCEHSENYTNSRNPRSPECQALKNRPIEFNNSPCEKKPLREFQLPPHCIRETGPRSPVGEYMAIIRVPKPVKKQVPQEEPVEKPKETEPAPKKGQAEEAKPVKKKSKRISRKGKGKARNVNENAKSECLNKITSTSLQLYVAKQGSPSNQAVLVVPSELSDCSLPQCEESFNNNYGGESYRISRYSSVGPVQIDFSELNARVNRYPNMTTHRSASSAFVARYSRPNYPTPSSRCDVRDITSYVSQIYSRDSRTVLDSHHRGDSWSRPKSLATASNVCHKHPENRPLAFNRSTNSTCLESSDVLNTTKYNVRLETAIENKIRELRDSKVFRSPPARKKMYSNALFEQMAKAHENSNLSTKRNRPQEEFIRESLDQLKHRAERRKQEFKHANAFLNISLPNETSSKQVAQEDVNYQPHIDTSSNKTTTVLYSQNTINRARDTAPLIEVSKPKNDIRHTAHATTRIKKEMVCHFVKDSPETQTIKCTETGKFENIHPAPVTDYEPVIQSLFEKFEESAQMYARSKAEPDPTTDKDFKIKEMQPNIFKAFPEDSKDKFMHMNAPAVDSHEENQSSNRVDKCLANTRTKVAESSPPHKPKMVKSSDAENTSGCTSSCRINSCGTSSVSLAISRFTRCAHSSQSLSGSVSCVDTTTFTKVTDVHRNTEETPTDYSSNVVNRPLLASAVLSNTFNKPNESKDSRANSKSPHSQSKMSAENMSVPSSSGDSGSSVDPICPKHASKIANMTGNSSVDGTNEYYFSTAGATFHKDVGNKQPEAGDVSTFASSTDVDLLLPSQRPPSHVKSLTELMREFIRRNGTPV
ncbi:hypothetical protein BsWGS_15921 [Bradybaena similaris]